MHRERARMKPGIEAADAKRPLAVAFDVNETLTDLTPLREVFSRFGLGAMSLEWWFAVVLRDGIALSATGDAATFADLISIALDEVAHASGRTLPGDAGSELVEAFRRVPVRPDAQLALDRLRVAGVPAYALTNGSEGLARAIFERAGVLESFTDVLSVDAFGHWKPRPEPYHAMSTIAGVLPERLAMVAVHPWDLHGAAAAGLTTGWVCRDGRSYPRVFSEPTVRSGDLDGVVAELLSLDGP